MAASARPTILSGWNMPQPYLSSSVPNEPAVVLNGRSKSESALFSVARNSRGPSIGDGDANANVPEPKPNKPDQRSSPDHGCNKAGRQLQR